MAQTRRAALAGLSLASLWLPEAYAAAPKPGTPELGYFLPRTQVAFAVQQTLVSCGDTPEFEISASIAPKAVRDVYVKVDGNSGFLANRATTIEMDEDGILTAFNAKTESQAGPLIVSVIKAAATIGAVATNPTVGGLLTGAQLAGGTKYMAGPKAVSRPTTIKVTRLRCNDDAAAKVVKLGRARDEVERLTSAAASGDSSQTVKLALASAIKRNTELTEELSLSGKLLLKPAPVPVTATFKDLRGKIEPLDIAKWFWLKPMNIYKMDKRECDDAASVDAALRCLNEPSVGMDGYLAQVELSNTDLIWFGGKGDPLAGYCGTADKESGARTCESRHLLFRRPVRGSIAFTPVLGTCDPANVPSDSNCAADKRPFAASAKSSGKAGFPQLSRLSVYSTSGGGIFGSRTVKASFGPYGEPKSLTYDRGSASQGIASVLDASVAAGEKLSGAELAANKRLLDQLDTQKKLRAAIEEAQKEGED